MAGFGAAASFPVAATPGGASSGTAPPQLPAPPSRIPITLAIRRIAERRDFWSWHLAIRPQYDYIGATWSLPVRVTFYGLEIPYIGRGQANVTFYGLEIPYIGRGQANVTFYGLEVPYAARGRADVTFFGFEVAMSISTTPYAYSQRPFHPAWLFARRPHRWRPVKRRLAPPPPNPPAIKSVARRPPIWMFHKDQWRPTQRRFAPPPTTAQIQPFKRRLPLWMFTPDNSWRPSRRRFAYPPPGPAPLPFRRWVHRFIRQFWRNDQWRRRTTIRAFHPDFSKLRVTVSAADILTGGPSALIVPVTAADVLGGGNPGLIATVSAAEPLTGGDPALRATVSSIEGLTGGPTALRATVSAVEVLTVVPPEAYVAVLTFPKLIGLGWDVTKTPMFNTKIAEQTSGLEVRVANYQDPKWQFELTYDYLPNNPAGVEQTDLNTIMGFFLQCQGSFANFLFRDDISPDYQVRHTQQAVGDGVTLQWPFARNLGGFLEPVGQVDLSTIATFLSSAVSTITSEINIPNHGLKTGNGPYFVSTPGTLPSPLTATTPYWVIVVDANNIRLAQTYVNAQAGTYITLTTTGSGTITLAKGYSVAEEITENHSVPATMPYTVTVTNTPFISDQGVTTSGIALTKVTGSPGPMQYAVSSVGVYTFNAAQASATVAITYTYQVAPSAYTIVMPNQLAFVSAPASGAIIYADFDFFFVCRFGDDKLTFANFMYQLWELSKCTFISQPQPRPAV